MKLLTGIDAVLSVRAIVPVQGQRGHRIDEHPSRADFAGLGEQQAVCLLQLLVQDGTRREDDLDFTLSGDTSKSTISPGSLNSEAPR
jgi:hypothetical protein